MNLKKKILTGYGVSFALMGLVIAWSVVNLISLGRATEAILSENYRSILAAENMVDALERQDSAVLLVLLGDSELGTSQFRENEADFLEWLARAQDNITITGEAQLVLAIKEGFARFRTRFADLISWKNAARANLTLDYYHQSIYPLFAKVRENCIALRNLNEGTMYSASIKAGNVASHAIWSTVLVSATALFLALLFSLLLAEKIVRPVHSFMEASRKISSGDYEVQVPVETSDELGHLANEFNQMATRLCYYHEMKIDQVIAEKNKGEAILASIEDGMVVFDTQLKVTGINPAARRILSLSLAEPETLACTDLIPDAQVCELIRKIIETGIPAVIPDEQKIITMTTGEQCRHYLYSATPVLGRDRKISGIVLLLRDVTRLKEVEKLKSEFVMAASHELRTPLTSLGMSIDLLMEHAAVILPEKDQVLLKAAHEEVHRMKALVNDLLDLSKIEAGRIDLEFESVPVSTIFTHVMKVFESQLIIKEVSLHPELDNDLPKVRADANKITWVLSNLISNALRYAGKGGHIRMAAHLVGPNVHINVQDDGPGIPAEYQTRIFLKFVQIKGRETGGTGLGLAICKEIVRAHGGAIWVESNPGKGSTFTFTLPVTK